MANGFRFATGLAYASVFSLVLFGSVSTAESQPSNVTPGASIGDVAARCAQRLQGLNRAYVMFYAVHAYSVADEGPDLTRDLARADRLRAERLILVALKIPQLTGVLRRAFLDARDGLLNEDALED